MSDIICVAAIDDHPLYLAGVQRALRGAQNIAIIAEGKSAADACLIAKTHAPAVMLIDISMPGGGINAAAEIIAKNREIRVIMLTADCSEEQVSTALSVGAMGYVLKGAGAEELLEAINTVHEGKPFITPSLASQMIVRREQKARASSGNKAALSKLNTRERAMLDLTAKGLRNDEIAVQLGLKTSTTKNYMSRIFAKLNVNNRLQAVALMLK